MAPSGNRMRKTSAITQPCALAILSTLSLLPPELESAEEVSVCAGLELVLLLEEVPDDVGALAVGVVAAATKGLRLSPPVALLRSKFKFPLLLCSSISADAESLLSASPDFAAHIQFEEEDLTSRVPPFQDSQLEP